ncbi:MAG: aminopeptidase [Clostridia bacterium]|nr:aminopeptidase [Clostridia bacterium]
MKRKYARMLVTVGMNVQKNQPVLIESEPENSWFANMVAEEAYAAGASNVIISYIDKRKLKLDALNRPLSEVASYPEWQGESYTQIMHQRAATLRLESEYPDLMRNLSDDKAAAVFEYIDGLRNIMRGIMAVNHTQWCIAVVPNQTWAEKIYPGEDKAIVLEKFWNQLFKLCYLDETNDPVATWKAFNERRSEISEKLDALDLVSLRFMSSNGTDLTVGLGERSKFGMPKAAREKLRTDPSHVPFAANIPSEEHCTTPLRYKTEGIVYSTRPLLVGGKMVDRFWIRFEHGKAVDCGAAEGEDMLRSIINTDENSAYLGEVAMVEYHSPISLSGLTYYTTLIDENASCHLALGRALLDARSIEEENGVKTPYNHSKIHIDFMFGAPDTQVTGVTRSGQTVSVMKNGDFSF